MEKIKIYTRGSSRGTPGPAKIEVQVVAGDKTVVLEISESIGNAFPDYAEYSAVARALQAVADHYGAQTTKLQFELVLDNELVKRQLNDESQINEPGLVPHFIMIHNLRVTSFPNLSFMQLQHESSKQIEHLVKEALDAN